MYQHCTVLATEERIRSYHIKQILSEYSSIYIYINIIALRCENHGCIIQVVLL